jgi:hypothetical protein
MERSSRLLAAIILAWGAVVALGSGVAIADERGVTDAQELAPFTRASLSPVLSFIAPGETCAISVVAESSGDSLGCIECWVTYDTAFVSVQLAEEGALFKNAPYPRLFFSPQIAPDTRSVEGCLLGAGTYCRTPGEIARYVFKAKKAGTCPVHITRLNLWDIRRVVFQPVVDPNAWIVIGTATGIEPPDVGGGGLACFPNPFNPATTLILSLPGTSQRAGGADARVAVYTPEGRMVRELFDGHVGPGGASFVWDGKDQEGRDVSSGVYFAAAETDGGTFRSKIVLVR